jgi:UDP-glucose 4-epimerase
MNGENQKGLATGGASFIGPGMAGKLLARGPRLGMMDVLGSGPLENIQGRVDKSAVKFRKGGLRDDGAAVATER